jgi:hypothetical protein
VPLSKLNFPLVPRFGPNTTTGSPSETIVPGAAEVGSAPADPATPIVPVSV